MMTTARALVGRVLRPLLKAAEGKWRDNLIELAHQGQSSPKLHRFQARSADHTHKAADFLEALRKQPILVRNLEHLVIVEQNRCGWSDSE